MKIGLKVKYRVFQLLLLLFLSFSISFLGYYFDGVREKIFGGSGFETYRGFLEREFPILPAAFDDGATDYGFKDEFNNLLESIFYFDLRNIQSILESRICMLKVYLEDNPHDLLSIKESAPKGKELEGRTFISNGIYQVDQSSLSYEEHMADESKAETLGKTRFIKECDVKFTLEELSMKKVHLDPSKKNPGILIYHTHSKEQYEKSGGLFSGFNIPANVVGIGAVLASELKKFDIPVIHNGTPHDVPSAKGAYANSLKTAQSILKNYPSIQISIDLHRDGLSTGQKFAPTTKYEGKNVAKVMFVVGTNASGLEHPMWKHNLAFSVELQKKLEQICQGITRGIYISKNRYNQHILDNAIIVEIGGDGNTTQEAAESAKILAKALAEII